MNKKLNDVLLKLDQDLIKYVKGSLNLEISGVTYSSKLVLPRFVFFALPGIRFDGHDFIEMAIQKGSNVIVCSRDLDFYSPNVTYIKVDDFSIRKFMSNFSNIFYDEPSKKLKVIGVTGTDGKSSVCYYIYLLLKKRGIKVGFVSTVFFDDGSGSLIKNPYRQSTPESTEIHAFLSNMVKNGVQYAVLESTSHGLDFETARLIDVNYFAAVFTNIGHDHLEFHGTIRNYVNVKLGLFQSVSDDAGFGVINLDDVYSSDFKNAIKKSFTYSLKNSQADFFVSFIDEKTDSTRFEFYYKGIKYFANVNLLGSFNVENVMAALILVSKLLNIDIQDIVDELVCIKSLDGRMDSINLGQNFSVIIDYAHTPGAFSKLFPIFKRFAINRLISVFGSAGERDVAKRFLQGQISDIYSDLILLCDEDPRGENSMCIIKDIAKGIVNKVVNRDLFFIPDRRQAIEKAISLARAGDLVVALGKGHESSIIYKNREMFWNEQEVVKNAILSLEKEK
ncbi:UDP-N-acetylmuramoyl-L-alanyl-D-glutamate--2,6-diaminopimelate ligase [Borreliella spielmanii]|uniref:UDP-N-acetylmuramyl-tripeptide synthetase n=1 Tax=Borreliella spielmanii A14S TaxID=498742 RepID=C0APT7_9SPIR|nr:UDP-N-acetylmuramoyl-L-alanyl-D-glutamate--2,6-diaminopimelate ligase [Borreliella spielmanii]EEF84697.1 UDP-N-acetylmuramoylalanyl-D-glutamate--2,6-diaminopimelate ligase [Borreliella spielmanii A14S]WKC83294.1 UDP-N-acetylmuramoyl-L-alanyl-D-glutamate--2,6-diaminopimelate ligase [Borreliella spielmanii]